MGQQTMQLISIYIQHTHIVRCDIVSLCCDFGSEVMITYTVHYCTVFTVQYLNI